MVIILQDGTELHDVIVKFGILSYIIIPLHTLIPLARVQGVCKGMDFQHPTLTLHTLMQKPWGIPIPLECPTSTSRLFW